MKKILSIIALVVVTIVTVSAQKNTQKPMYYNQFKRAFSDQIVNTPRGYQFLRQNEKDYSEAFLVNDGSGGIVEVYKIKNTNQYTAIIAKAEAKHCLANNNPGPNEPSIYCVEGSCDCSSCCPGSGDSGTPSMLRTAKPVDGKPIKGFLYIQ